MARPKKRRYVDSTITGLDAETQRGDVERLRLKPPQVGAFTFQQALGPDVRITGTKGVYLTEWLGKGIDAWVELTIQCIWDFAVVNQRETATLVSYGDSLKTFFDFLTGTGFSSSVPHPQDTQPIHIQEYYGWLRRRVNQNELSKESSRRYYSGLKAVIKRLVESGVIKSAIDRLFPSRQFRGSGTDELKYEALSERELGMLASALKADLTDLHHGRLKLRPSEAISSYFLQVAMRTGANLTPLLEARRDALKSGLLPTIKILELHKRRSHSVKQQSVGTDEGADGPVTVPLETVAVWNYVLRTTEPFLVAAPKAAKNRVWLYQVSRGAGAGRIAALDTSTLRKSIQKLVQRRQLTTDQGKPLRITMRRLRKSFANRVFVASGGDLAVTADLLGSVPEVADRNYLVMSDELREAGARFMSGSLTQALKRRLSRNLDKVSAPLEPSARPEATPIAHCANTVSGELAPQDGVNHCIKFALCFFCSSFTVVGDEEELWRLFSYQVFVEREIARLNERYGKTPCGEKRIDDLQEMYAQIVPFISQFVAKRFGHRVAARARKRAEAELHPFWRYQDNLSQSSDPELPMEHHA